MLLKLVTKVFLTVLALLLVAQFVPGIEVSGFYIALIVALLLGVINVTLKPILLILTLPISLVTLGLFTFIINALLFWFIASFVGGFEVSGFLSALVGATVISIVSSIGNRFID